MTLTFDCLQEAYETWEGTVLRRAMRTGVVSEIDVQPGASGRDPLVISKARTVTGLPTRGDGHPADSGCVCKYVSLSPWSNNTVKALCFYERPDANFSGPTNTFVIRDNTSVVAETTQLLPYSRTPIRVTYQPPGAPLKNISANVTVLIPHRELIAEGVVDLTKKLQLESAVGTVNDNTFRGLPRAYWLYSQLSSATATSDFSNPSGDRWYVQCTLATKNFEDWSTYAPYQQPDGTFIEVSQATIDAIKNATYTPNFINRSATGGLTRVMPYFVANFPLLFPGQT